MHRRIGVNPVYSSGGLGAQRRVVQSWDLGFRVCLLGFGAAMEDAPGEPSASTLLRCSGCRGPWGSAGGRIAAGRTLMLDLGIISLITQGVLGTNSSLGGGLRL